MGSKTHFYKFLIQGQHQALLTASCVELGLVLVLASFNDTESNFGIMFNFDKNYVPYVIRNGSHWSRSMNCCIIWPD